MFYRNKKTGAEFESPCAVSGENWERIDDEMEEAEATEETEEIRLSELTVAQLKDLAEELEIDLGNATKKDDIIAVMLESEENSAE